MGIVSEKEFCEIISSLQAANDLRDNIDGLMRKAKENIQNDFMNAAGLMICHEPIVLDLLAMMLDDKDGDIEYFVYEMDYGRKYRPGMITDADDKEIDISTPQKLYRYLVNTKEARDASP